MSMAECPFTPPYPVPPARKPGLLLRFMLGWGSWVHTLFAGAYTMKLGHTRLPRLSVFMVNELPLVRRVLGGDAFPKHGLLSDMLGPLVGSSVFSANGAEWRRQRAMVNPAFVHANLARAFPMMLAAADEMVARLRCAAKRGPVCIDPLMTHVTADIIFRTLFSVPLDEKGARTIHAAFERYQRHAQRSAVLGLYRLPRLGFGWRAQRAARDIRAVFEPLVHRRLAQGAGGKACGQADLLDALIAARDGEGGQPFTPGELVDQIAVLFLAGHETSASALAWTLYLLAASPAWQDKARAAVREAFGDGPPDHATLKTIQPLRNIFREALRLYPPVSFLPRASAVPVILRDKPVAPQDLLIVAPWLIHRNPDHWPCPHAFDPDRFSREEEAQAVRHAWLPFGQGERLCVGAGFAMQEAMIVLARVVQQVALEPVGTPEVVSRLTLRARRGIHLRVRALSDPPQGGGVCHDLAQANAQGAAGHDVGGA